MKILIVSETPNSLDTYNKFFSDNGFSTICYSWLVKALDNIEEINPEIIFVNAVDYPRTWKVLIQNARQVSKSLKHCIVVVPEELDDDEQKKLKTLEAICVKPDFTQTAEAEFLLDTIKSKQQTRIKEALSSLIDNEDENDDIDEDEEFFNILESDKILTLTIPEAKIEITGKIVCYEDPVIIFMPNNIDHIKLFPFGRKFFDCTFYDAALPAKISIQVQGMSDRTVEFCIIK